MTRLEELTEQVKSICSRGVSSPIEISKIQIELENEILDLKLAIAKQTKERAINYYAEFRKLRWDDDITKTYNEASAAAKASMAKYDQQIAELKAYKDYFDNLSSIIKSFMNSFYRD
jgi:hypothetical protein